MKYPVYCAALAFTLIGGVAAQAEILAMANYESKPADALKAFKHPVAGRTRQEGIAIIDVDPASPNFRKIVETIALPSDLVAHHIFYNRDSTKAYVTSLGKSELGVRHGDTTVRHEAGRRSRVQGRRGRRVLGRQ